MAAGVGGDDCAEAATADNRSVLCASIRIVTCHSLSSCLLDASHTMIWYSQRALGPKLS